MKKLVLCATVGLFLIGVIACGGGGKYADAKALIEDTLDATETFIAACDKIKNVDDAIAAVTDYAEAMKELQPKIKEMQEKYPELKDEKNPPEELKDLMKRTEEVMPKIMGAMGKLMQYASDPKFMEAQKKLGEAMGK
jgi:hypothetical protein